MIEINAKDIKHIRTILEQCGTCTAKLNCEKCAIEKQAFKLYVMDSWPCRQGQAFEVAEYMMKYIAAHPEKYMEYLL